MSESPDKDRNKNILVCVKDKQRIESTNANLALLKANFFVILTGTFKLEKIHCHWGHCRIPAASNASNTSNIINYYLFPL